MKAYVAGHRGLVGSAICRELERRGDSFITRTSKEMDLRQESAVHLFFEHCGDQFDCVYLAAAHVGGIVANNSQPFDFIYNNLMIQNNIILACRKYNKKLCFLGSSCIYPRECPQPIKEEYLMTGPLEPTNSAYAVAKIAGIEMCKAAYKQGLNDGTSLDSIIIMPCNLYGPNDNFDLTSSHVLPALMRKFHEAKVNNISRIEVWGDGSPWREFLHVDDLAKACVHLMDGASYNADHPIINVGSETEVTIRDLTFVIASIVEYRGEWAWDCSKPNGTPRKIMDSSYIRSLGWKPSISLYQGVKETYEWYMRTKTQN